MLLRKFLTKILRDMVKIVCLGNEFIEEDCFAKEVGALLCGEFEVVNVKDSFGLMGIVSSGEDFVILDVVDGLKEVCFIDVTDLKVDSILSVHDFDAGYVLGLMGNDVKIIGMPRTGNKEKILLDVKNKLATDYTD